jgi:phage baseplate assembly protein W
MAQSAFLYGFTQTGIGWPWSPTGPQSMSDIELVKAKIGLVLFTPLGAHKMEPTFGSNLLALVFENRGPILRSMADLEIRGALGQWLPEVRVMSVTLTEDDDIEGLVTIDVNYEYLGQPGQWSGTPTPPSGSGGL